MNIFAQLREKATPVPASRISGHWFNIRLTPDLATGEVFNVGVGFIDASGNIHVKTLSNFERLKCLYGDRIDVDDLSFLMKALQKKSFSSPGANIIFSAKKYASGEDIEAIIESLYQETVTLDPCSMTEYKKTTHDAHVIDTKKARQFVFNAMLKKSPESQLMIPDDALWHIEKNKSLDIPIRADSLFGTVISAWYKSKSSLEMNALKSQVDLDMALHLFPHSKSGLFILRPDCANHECSKEQLRNIGNVLDLVEWRLKAQNISLEVEDNPEALADRVLEWADLPFDTPLLATA